MVHEQENKILNTKAILRLMEKIIKQLETSQKKFLVENSHLNGTLYISFNLNFLLIIAVQDYLMELNNKIFFKSYV
jgi:hypothetical protein